MLLLSKTIDDAGVYLCLEQEVVLGQIDPLVMRDFLQFPSNFGTEGLTDVVLRKVEDGDLCHIHQLHDFRVHSVIYTIASQAN